MYVVLHFHVLYRSPYEHLLSHALNGMRAAESKRSLVFKVAMFILPDNLFILPLIPP